MSSRIISILLIASISLAMAVRASSQSQTTGRIAGTVRDAQGAVIVGAEVRVENPATADKHSAITDSSANYSILQLSPATFFPSDFFVFMGPSPCLCSPPYTISVKHQNGTFCASYPDPEPVAQSSCFRRPSAVGSRSALCAPQIDSGGLF